MKTTNQKKFENQHPVQQILIKRFQKKFLEMIRDLNPSSVLEVGCGEGFLMQTIAQTLPSAKILGLDVNDEALAEGRRLWPKLSFAHGDIFHLEQPDSSWELVIASEVLEHLDDPKAALREMGRVSSRAVLLSVPHEPWFRMGNLARGRDLRRWGNHPEHVNQWSPQAFASVVGEVLKVDQLTGSFPWTIVLAHR